MKRLLRKIYNSLIYPFRVEFHLLLILSLLVCGPMVYYWAFMNSREISFILWEAAHGYLLCYISLILAFYIPKNIRVYFKLLLIILACFDCFIESACIHVTRSPFGFDHVAIIMSTNISEGVEFISTYCTWDVIVFIISFLLASCGIYFFRNSFRKFTTYITFPLCCFSIFAFGYLVLKGSESWDCKFYNKVFALASYENPPDLRQYNKRLHLKVEEDNLPHNIVLILGESFAKSHSSLYGYKKLTNPYLSSMVNDSLLVVYDNVVAPADNTIPCVKSIFSTYKQEYKDSVKWYECETLINIMSHCGYKTIWISNQSPTGIYDNVAARYAELCDSTCWVGSKYKGVNKSDYDGELLNVICCDDKLDSYEKKFVVIHLMGSHFEYKFRYPKDWERFNEKDYPDLSENQRRIISEYDNSVLYNDYVVSRLLKHYNDKETLAFYFSDHGLDLFESSDDYFGYAIKNNVTSQKIARSIPFFVYMSPSLLTNHHEIINFVKEYIHQEFCTQNIIDYLAELLGICCDVVTER